MCSWAKYGSFVYICGVRQLGVAVAGAVMVLELGTVGCVVMQCIVS